MVKLSNNDWLQINSIIAKINKEQDDKTLRHIFLNDFKELINYDFGVFDLILLKDGNFLNLYDPVVDSIYDTAFEKDFISSHDNKYCRMSYSRWIHYEKKPIVYNETDFISDEIRKESLYFTEYLEPRGFIYSCGCNLVHDGINIGALTFYRTKEHKDFEARDLFIIEQLQPHIINRLYQCLDIVDGDNDTQRFVLKFNLTDREIDIITLTYVGLNNKEIGEKLFISINTVKKHLNNVFSKLNVKSRSQLNNFLNETGFDPQALDTRK